ncbi:MAG: PAS domain S-box protein [Actinomycetota bacterium]|nr:PAS domain S-box protein [Actinomycetota bacterium]
MSEREQITLEQLGFGRLFQRVRDAIIVANARTERIVAWNSGAAAMFGYTEEEARDLLLHELVPENLRTLHRTGIARYQETGSGNLIDSATAVELVGLHKDGHEVPVELTLTGIPDPIGRGDRYALAILRDIADRKAAEVAALQLRDSQLRQQQAFELNDTIVQGLTVAKMSLEAARTDEALEAITVTLERVKAWVGELLAQIGDENPVQPGDLVRSRPATVVAEEEGQAGA